MRSITDYPITVRDALSLANNDVCAVVVADKSGKVLFEGDFDMCEFEDSLNNLAVCEISYEGYKYCIKTAGEIEPMKYFVGVRECGSAEQAYVTRIEGDHAYYDRCTVSGELPMLFDRDTAYRVCSGLCSNLKNAYIVATSPKHFIRKNGMYRYDYFHD